MPCRPESWRSFQRLAYTCANFSVDLILAILLSYTESRPCGTFWRQLWRCNWLAWGDHVLHRFFRRLGPVRRKSANCSWYRRLWQRAFSEIRHVEMAGLWLDLVDFSHLSLLAGFSSFVPTQRSNARTILGFAISRGGGRGGMGGGELGTYWSQFYLVCPTCPFDSLHHRSLFCGRLYQLDIPSKTDHESRCKTRDALRE